MHHIDESFIARIFAQAQPVNSSAGFSAVPAGTAGLQTAALQHKLRQRRRGHGAVKRGQKRPARPVICRQGPGQAAVGVDLRGQRE